MARFVVQQHAMRHGTHFDMMLEQGDALLTWLIDEPPDGPDHRAVRLENHRKAYLVYEGEVSGNRGTVRIWDKGDLEILEQTDDHLLFALNGKILSGRFGLLQEGDDWTLTRLPE